jgi:hypothetical protein
MVRSLSSRTLPRLAFFALLALVLVYPLLGNAALLNEFRDAQVLQAYEHDAVISVSRFGQAPLWDPYYCGGLYALGSPQSRFASPLFAFSLWFGARRASVVIAFFMFAVGMEGAYRFLRARKAGALGSTLAAPLFASSGLFAVSYFNGWINFFGFELLPWALWGTVLLARGRAAGVLIVAASAACMVGFGGTYSTPIAAIGCAAELARTLATERRARFGWLRALVLAAVGVVVATGLSAYRLWPVIETMRAAPRVMVGTPTMDLSGVANALLWPSAPSKFGFGEIGAFLIGWPALGIAAVGAPRRRHWPAVLLALLALFAATGYLVPYGPFPLLRKLPVFDTLRYPERFLICVALYTAELCAAGVSLLVIVGRRRKWPRPAVWIAAVILLSAFVIEAKSLHDSAARMWFGAAPIRVDRPFQQARGTRWGAAHYAPMSRGSLSCWDAYPVPQSSRLRGDLEHEEYLADPSLGTVVRELWSPNRIDVHVSLRAPGRLVVNQNWHPGWKSNVGRAMSDAGLLAVDLPEGDHTVSLRFLPRSATGGAMVSLITLAVALAAWLKSRRTSSARGLVALACAVVLLPAAAFAATRVLIDEPDAPVPVARNMNGEAVVLEALPADASALAVQFVQPVSLVGAHVPAVVPAGAEASFDLYFRVTGSVANTVGVFVHLTPASGKVVNADHQVVGASFVLSGAPRDKVIRDAFAARLSGAPPGVWRVWVGLWDASGNRQRIRVQNANGVRVEDNGILVGEVRTE